MAAEAKTEPMAFSVSVPKRQDDAANQLVIGWRAGDYVIEELLGTGGFAHVYRATHRVLGRSAAVKVLSQEMASSHEMVQRFIREARVVNKIHHPNIVDIYDFGYLDDGRPYFVMELLRGKSLAALIASRGRISAADALSYLEPVCSALHAAHKAGVVHRDLKASNIMVCGDEHQSIIKLLDFGIAKLIHLEPGEAGLTTEERRLGTSHAMSPEQIRGGVIDARTDVYGLGVLLFRLLTSQHPFWSENPLEIERLHLQAPPPRPSQFAPVSPAVDVVVVRCMEKDPARRYPSALAFIDALRGAVGAGAIPLQSAHKAVRAAAVYAEVSLDDSREPDDRLLEALARAMDRIEQALAASKFVSLLQTGSGILAVRPLPDNPSAAGSARAELLKIAREIHSIALAEASDPRLRIHVCSHIAPADARTTVDGLQIVGGPIAQLDAWVVRNPGGWYASPAALEGLVGEHS
jgi:eukaryotic-like serine/threonine-protein kinase